MAKYETIRRIDSRLRERDASAVNPVFVGLLNPNSQGGVFINSAPATSTRTPIATSILNYLAVNLYGGGGGHSIFMKTAGAGLAYSNGIGNSLSLGRLRYYAERTPELPQTMRFVIDQLKSATPDPSLVDYAIAQAFGGTRSAALIRVAWRNHGSESGRWFDAGNRFAVSQAGSGFARGGGSHRGALSPKGRCIVDGATRPWSESVYGPRRNLFCDRAGETVCRLGGVSEIG